MGTSLGAMQGQEKCQLGRKYTGGIQHRLGGTGNPTVSQVKVWGKEKVKLKE